MILVALYDVVTNKYVDQTYVQSLPSGPFEYKGVMVNATTDLLTQSFFCPKREAGAWVEGEDIENLKKSILTNLQNEFVRLRRRALASSIQKTGDHDYILEQSEQYKLKYRVAKDEIVSTVITELITAEAEEMNLTLSQMKSLIIQMYEAGETFFNNCCSLIERARAKGITMLELNDLNRAIQVVELMRNVPETFDMQEFENQQNILEAI